MTPTVALRLSPEGLEELRKRVARMARNDETVSDLCEINFIDVTGAQIETAILASEWLMKRRAYGSELIVERPRKYSRILTVLAARLFDLIAEEIGQPIAFTMRSAQEGVCFADTDD